MKVLPLHKAWSILGRDASTFMKEVSILPRSERVAALQKFAEEAKRLAKSLMVKHHPDRGGDEVKFKEVQDALLAITYHTDEFVKNTADIARKAEEMTSRRPVFIDVKK